MRTVEEIQEELDDVVTAMRMIAKGAQSYTIGSRSVTKANLSELRKWRAELESELDDALGTSVRVLSWQGR